MARHKKPFQFVVIAVMLALVIFIASNLILISGPMKVKVLLIGIDALDPKIMEKLMEQGKLPNFKKLKDNGSYSRLQTTVPPESPVAWSAAATGTNSGKYDIFDFVGRDPGTYLPKLTLAEEKQTITGTKYKSGLKGKPFWKMTSEAGIPTTVIRWPVTFPPEKINGRMLSGLGTVDIKGFQNSYRFYTSGQYDKKSEGAEKVVEITSVNDIIETKLFGPLVRKGNSVVEFEKPMKIKLNYDEAVISMDDENHAVKVNSWSDWIRVKFEPDFLTETYGIFKAYLLSLEPDFEMYVTSLQIDPKNPVADITYPKDYGKELANEIGLFYTLGMPEDTKAVTENRIGKQVFLEQINQIEDERTKMFWYEFGKFDNGIYAFAFDAGDRLQHIFWENTVLEQNNSELKIPKEIEDYYIEKDGFLGELLGKLNEDTFLIIFSDHGFSNFERAVSTNTWLVENGYMTLTKNPEANDAGGLFKYVDWDKTKAYSLGFASIYINLQERESKGIVAEKEYNELVAELIGKLDKLTDIKYGKKAITKLYKGKDIYQGRYAENAPDIVIGFEPGYRMSWQNAIGGLTPEVILDNDQEWVGDHLIDRSHVPGIIFTNFEIKKDNPSLIDIAPTIISILGLELSNDIDGKSLAG